MTIPPAIRELLVCPRCHGELADADQGRALDCPRCALRYPVRDGIPVMLADQTETRRPDVS